MDERTLARLAALAEAELHTEFHEALGIEKGKAMNLELERYVGELRELRRHKVRHKFDFELGMIAMAAIGLLGWLIAAS